MPRFNIFNQASGRDLGTYEAPDSDAAVDLMAKDAGYINAAYMRAQTGEDPDLIVTRVGLPPIRCGQFVTVKLGGDHLLWLACGDEDRGLLRITPVGSSMVLPPIHTVRREDVELASDGNGAPGPAAIVALRKAAGLTQTEAAELVHRKLRTWQEWESGNSAIDMACWELFVTKAVRGKA